MMTIMRTPVLMDTIVIIMMIPVLMDTIVIINLTILMMILTDINKYLQKKINLTILISTAIMNPTTTYLATSKLQEKLSEILAMTQVNLQKI